MDRATADYIGDAGDGDQRARPPGRPRAPRASRPESRARSRWPQVARAVHPPPGHAPHGEGPGSSPSPPSLRPGGNREPVLSRPTPTAALRARRDGGRDVMLKGTHGGGGTGSTPPIRGPTRRPPSLRRGVLRRGDRQGAGGRWTSPRSPSARRTQAAHLRLRRDDARQHRSALLPVSRSVRWSVDGRGTRCSER